jgi:CheY-like chemotaxis protein
MSDTPARLRILVVEDEAVIAMLMEEMVAEIGHRVAATAGRIEEAATLAETGDFDFAILDVNLDGVRTYRVASLLSARGIPFVFATGYGSAGLDAQWQDRVTLQKPFQSGDLARAIGALVKT